ncbi:MAG: T9SS type A sorting domain-containing protein [Bacteroidetes bacterium]|nr:T9SS type A sorting domain-containing protein [Bacteroidota bacterium]
MVASFTNGVTYSWSTSGPAIVTGNQPQFPASPNTFKPEILFNSTTNQQPTVTYVDTLIFTNGIRCFSTATNTVVVNPAAPKALVTDLTAVSGAIPTNLCGGTEFNSFNVTNGINGINYTWLTSPPNVIVHEPDSLNTVITFPDSSSSYTATIVATSLNQIALGGCPNDSTVFTVEISAGDQIQEAPIILKQPGNLLVYLDNTALGYEWGFDSKNTLLPSKIAGQIYQVLDHPAVLPFDTTSRDYWVLVYKNNCVTKVYFNGPYSISKGTVPDPVPDEVTALVYPNPNSGNFEILVSGNIYQNVYFKIINHIGQVVHTETLNKEQPAQNYTFTIPNLAKGLYLIEIRGDFNEQATHKMLIK